MAQFRLHCVGASGNAYKVALYLNCAGLDWEPVTVDFAGGQTRDPAWRAGTNPMGEVPVLEVAGKRLSQSGAILMWLADWAGKFAPEDADQRLEALRWMLFDNHKFTGNLSAYRFQNSLAPQAPHPAVMDFLKGRFDAALGVVATHLATRPFMLGDKPTIVDFSMVGYLYYPVEETGYDFATVAPTIDLWRKRIAALPGWKPPYELMPGPTLPLRKS